jgi:hypothetical protein
MSGSKRYGGELPKSLSPDLDMPDRALWTVRVRAEGEAPHETVVLVPPMGDPWWNGYDSARSKVDDSLARGFELARPHVGKGRVRLIGRGATVEEFWPAWVRTADDLVLTEFDAYLPKSRAALLAELVPAAGGWIRDVFGQSLDGCDPAKAFWGSTLTRVLASSFAAWPVVLGLAVHHGRDSLLCGEPKWAGCAALAAAIQARGGDFTLVPSARPRVPFAAALAAETVASLGLGAAKRGLEFWREGAARRWIRQQRGRGESPRVWLGVNAGAGFSCRHIVEGVAPKIPADVEVGVLLHASLAGAADQPRPWPILGDLAAACPGGIGRVEQCASVESWRDLAAALWRTSTIAARGVSRIASAGEGLRLGPMLVSLRPQTRNLARLLTMDVLRGIEAAVATRALLAREAMKQSHVVWPHASLVGVCAADLLVQAAGAHTVDLVHGMLSDATMMIMFEQTFSTTKALWTEAEAAFCGPFSGAKECRGGFVPRRLASRVGPRPPGPVRVLVATNYLLETQREGPVIHESYQRALMAALVPTAQRLGRRIELRWRPHPSESPSRIAHQLALRPGIFSHVSRERGALQTDLAWADVVITSVSSAIVEALCHPVAIIVHDIPIYEQDGILASIRRERRFQSSWELAPLVERVVAALEDGDAAVFEPDHASRRAVFGQSGLPHSVGELLLARRTASGGVAMTATRPS